MTIKEATDQGDYETGYAAGKEKSHLELRQWQPGDHTLACGCDVCVTVRTVIDTVVTWPIKPKGPKVSCRICGCTDDDCSGCVERTGVPCHWVEYDLCSACASSGEEKASEGAGREDFMAGFYQSLPVPPSELFVEWMSSPDDFGD